MDVAVTSDDDADELRITLDGAVPREDDKLYLGPFEVSATAQPVVVRARAWVEGLWPSRVATATFSENPSILGDGLRVVSLAVDPFDLFDEDTYILLRH